MNKHGREKHTEYHKYNEKYDSYYCEKCDCWLENKCSDQNCKFCTARPERPLQTKKPMLH